MNLGELKDWATVGAVIVSICALVVTFRLARRQSQLTAFSNLHHYLSREDLQKARMVFRSGKRPQIYAEWDDQLKDAANRIAGSYDQAGLILSVNSMIGKSERQLLLKSSWGDSILDQFEALWPFLEQDQRSGRVCPEGRSGFAFFRHFQDLYFFARRDKRLPTIKIISGGQSGVDRAALQFAAEFSLPYGGYCPRNLNGSGGGSAEDLKDGELRQLYPALVESWSEKPEVRTRQNVDQSYITVVIKPSSKHVVKSAGTQLTIETASKQGKCVVLDPDDPASSNRLSLIFKTRKKLWVAVNIAGPRQSEWPEGQEQALGFLTNAYIMACRE